MIKKISIIFVLAISLVSFQLYAGDEGDTYFGGAYHMGDYKEDGLDAFEPTGLKLMGGKYVSSNVAVEAQFMLGLAGDERDELFTDGVTVQSIALDFELDNAISLFIKGEVPLESDSIDLYGKLGYTKAKLVYTATGPGGSFSASESESDLSYGVGVGFNVSDTGSFVVEYISYLDDALFSYTGIDIGYVMSY